MAYPKLSGAECDRFTGNTLIFPTSSGILALISFRLLVSILYVSNSFFTISKVYFEANTGTPSKSGIKSGNAPIFSSCPCVKNIPFILFLFSFK